MTLTQWYKSVQQCKKNSSQKGKVLHPTMCTSWQLHMLSGIHHQYHPSSINLLSQECTDPLPLVASVHSHSLRVPARFPVSTGADWSAATCTSSTTLFECQQLFGTECFVVNLGGCFDEVLEVGTCQEIPEVDKFTVLLILDYSTLVTKRSGVRWDKSSPLITPHLFCRPRTCFPSTMIVFSDPTTAKGIISYY